MASTLTERLARVAGKSTARLMHYGRKTGKTYEVTIWFIVEGERILLPTANVSRQWVRNVKKMPRVRLRIGGDMFDGEARFLDDTAQRDHVMDMVRRKYWVFFPLIALGQILTVLGVVPNTTGAFEVTIAQG